MMEHHLKTIVCASLLLASVFVSGCNDAPAADSPAPAAETATADVPESAAQPNDAQPGDEEPTTEPNAEASAEPATKTKTPETKTDETSDAASQRPIDITFDTLKFEMELLTPFERTMLTPEIEKLFGRRVRIRGFMGPTYQAEGIKTFPLYRNTECPFLGPKCPLYDLIVIDMNEGKSASYSTGAVAVEGILRFKEFRGYDDRHVAIYQIEADSAK